mmetsp:Transcript_113029/g.258922  ORF Transcript_113029/g.258922 Transcript_113029/m.258922 type:complete len:213 (+) Transcript_113029:2857-3495(+)
MTDTPMVSTLKAIVNSCPSGICSTSRATSAGIPSRVVTLTEVSPTRSVHGTPIRSSTCCILPPSGVTCTVTGSSGSAPGSSKENSCLSPVKSVIAWGFVNATFVLFVSLIKTKPPGENTNRKDPLDWETETVTAVASEPFRMKGYRPGFLTSNTGLHAVWDVLVRTRKCSSGPCPSARLRRWRQAATTGVAEPRRPGGSTASALGLGPENQV